MVLCQQTQRESAMSIMKLFPRDEIGRAVSDEMAFAQNVRGAICLALVSDICQPSPTKELKKSGSQVQWKLRKLKHKSFYLGITNCELTGFVLVKKETEGFHLKSDRIVEEIQFAIQIFASKNDDRWKTSLTEVTC